MDFVIDEMGEAREKHVHNLMKTIRTATITIKCVIKIVSDVKQKLICPGLIDFLQEIAFELMILN